MLDNCGQNIQGRTFNPLDEAGQAVVRHKQVSGEGIGADFRWGATHAWCPLKIIEHYMSQLMCKGTSLAHGMGCCSNAYKCGTTNRITHSQSMFTIGGCYKRDITPGGIFNKRDEIDNRQVADPLLSS